MKRIMTAMMLSSCPAEYAAAASYQNPIPVVNNENQAMDAADPFVLRFNGKYYLYTTGREEIRVYESENLVHWTYRGFCTQGGEVYNAFAPEVIYWRGAFYMITSPKGNGHYILRSDSPLGPFEKVTGNFGHAIDGSFFVTDDGRLWMLCLQNNAIAQTEIDPDTMLPTGPKFNTGATLYHWTEGPGLIRRGEWYYLTLTGNHFLSTGYRVAWASRKGEPLGAYTQRDDCTMLINSAVGDSFTGLGHSSNFYGPDLESMYTSYHCHAVSATGGFERHYNLDRLLTNGGALYSTGPTHTPMPVPAMPDVYGDLQKDCGNFEEEENGYFAQVEPARRFTQECNFILTGGEMAWQMGSCHGQRALIITNGRVLRFVVGDEVMAEKSVPELGEAGRLHTLRVECTENVLYASIDAMRLITVSHPGVTADYVGALKGEAVAYSFAAHTGRALGDGDYLALKTVPGRFDALHCVDAADMETVEGGDQEERAVRLGSAAYAVRVARDASYCFDLTVCAQDTGKRLSIAVDGNQPMEMIIPQCPEAGAKWFTFTSAPMTLPAGNHALTISGDGTALMTVKTFTWERMEEKVWHFAEGDREGVVTLGGFALEEGRMAINAGKSGFALIGGQGCTDYEMRVSFLLPLEGTGACGFLARASEVSLYDAQVAESAFAYAIGVSRLGINMKRMNYGAPEAVDFVAVSAWADQTEAELILRVKGNKLQVFPLDGDQALATMTSAAPLTHGMAGLFSTGKEWKVTSIAMRPLEEEP